MGNKAEYTKGPWFVDEDSPKNKYHIASEIGLYVGTVSSNAGDAEALNNARLIAAAPELLECAHLALRSITELGSDEVEFIQATIAKAEGRL